MNIEETMNRATQRHQAGQLNEAEPLYRQIIDAAPDHAEAWNALGVLLTFSGRQEEGIAAFKQVIAIDPSHPGAHNNLGSAFKTTGRLNEAIDLYRRAAELQPEYANALANLGRALREAGRLSESIAALKAVPPLRPRDPESYFVLASALEAAGHAAEAVQNYDQAVALQPNSADAHFGRGNALAALGRHDEAIVSFQKALAIRPESLQIRNNLGIAFQDAQKLDEAIACFQQIVTHWPDQAMGHYNLGIALRDAGQMGPAINCFERAVALDEHNVTFDSTRVYSLQFDPGRDAESILREQKRWNDRHAAPLAGLIRRHENNPDPKRPLRIGYVSADFRDHVVGSGVLPLLIRHDPIQFPTFCYSNVHHTDDVTERFRAVAGTWRDIQAIDDGQAAELIRADGIDILIDLTLHMAGNRLMVFARKPAPVQVTFAGYPGGTGLSAIDWRLTDPFLDPPGKGDELYVEKSLRLAHSFWCYDPTTMDPYSTRIEAPPSQTAGHVTFGCLSHFNKINDHVLSLWARVLDAVPNSRLVLLAPPGAHRQAVADRLGGRVDFTGSLKRRQYVEFYNRIDVGLDPFPYGGHVTTLDSLWMGVPVATLIGSTVVGRAAWSHLNNLDLTDLAARTKEEYVALAAKLAKDSTRLGELRQSLRQRILASPLTDAMGFTRNVETAYRTAWANWCAAQA